VEPPRETEAPSSKPPHDGFDPAKEFARGVASLSAGDRGAAQRSFRRVADSHGASASLRHRAVFRWAELELARGESDRARAELADLLADADLSLAADAAFLLARSASVPAERAEVWGRYIARHPGTPYREDATLERAAALIDAGRNGDAADLLAQLSTEATLSKVQEARLRALQSQIGP
jgi:predicted negative regulator of RcsB-dependent stress response